MADWSLLNWSRGRSDTSRPISSTTTIFCAQCAGARSISKAASAISSGSCREDFGWPITRYCSSERAQSVGGLDEKLGWTRLRGFVGLRSPLRCLSAPVLRASLIRRDLVSPRIPCRHGGRSHSARTDGGVSTIPEERRALGDGCGACGNRVNPGEQRPAISRDERVGGAHRSSEYVH